MSALFARIVMVSEKHVKINGGTWYEGKGIPRCIKKWLVKDKIALELIQNTLKVAVLEGDGQLHYLVAISYYDL